MIQTLGRAHLAALSETMEQLRQATGADRTTARIDFDGYRFPVVAESLAPEMHSIRDDETFDLRQAPSSKTVLETRQVLVQNDCATHEFAPPPEFITRYEVRAQMLGPVVSGDRVIGIVSVHSRLPRSWQIGDLAALEVAVKVCGDIVR